VSVEKISPVKFII